MWQYSVKMAEFVIFVLFVSAIGAEWLILRREYFDIGFVEFSPFYNLDIVSEWCRLKNIEFIVF